MESFAVLVLAVHLAVIAFNLFGLVAIPLGAWRGWAFVRVRWWRALHLASLAVVALHVAATLWHAVIRRDDVAGRMIPRLSRKATG